MTALQRRPAFARGFTLLEMVAVVVAIGILAGVALERLLPLIGRAERVAFLRVQGQLQSALMLETARRLSRGEGATIPRLSGSNPMEYLLKPPENYLGSHPNPVHREMQPGRWYFDAGRGRLVYRVGRQARFESDEGPADRVEFRVALGFRDRNDNGIYDAGADVFDGIWMQPVYAFQWSE
jgi:general secretion pathway protein G